MPTLTLTLTLTELALTLDTTPSVWDQVRQQVKEAVQKQSRLDRSQWLTPRWPASESC